LAVLAVGVVEPPAQGRLERQIKVLPAAMLAAALIDQAVAVVLVLPERLVQQVVMAAMVFHPQLLGLLYSEAAAVAVVETK
jgi:hypothetical protein